MMQTNFDKKKAITDGKELLARKEVFLEYKK